MIVTSQTLYDPRHPSHASIARDYRAGDVAKSALPAVTIARDDRAGDVAKSALPVPSFTTAPDHRAGAIAKSAPPAVTTTRDRDTRPPSPEAWFQ